MTTPATSPDQDSPPADGPPSDAAEVAGAPSISVLIPQHGQVHWTRQAIAAIQRSSYPGEVEVLVFDDASPDGPGGVESIPGVSVVASEQRVGFGTAINHLASRARGELLFLLNNDTVVAPKALGRLAARLLGGEPRPSVVAPQTRRFDGTLLELGGFVGAGGEGYQLMRERIVPECFLRGAVRCHYVSGAALLVRRGDFLGSGGFDERYTPAYYEDTDLCLRLASGVGPVVVEPTAVVYHWEGGTDDALREPWSRGHMARQRGRFLARWHEALSGRPTPGEGYAWRESLVPAGARGLVLWVLSDMLKDDQSGGHARVRKEIEALRSDGWAVAVWAEDVGDTDRYGPRLAEIGVPWFGYLEPTRWPLAARRGSSFDTLPSLLSLGIWDAVVIWSAGTAASRLGLVRQLAPGVPVVVDSAVLMHAQSSRGIRPGILMPAAMRTERSWENAVYGAADAVIASSTADAETISGDLPHQQVFAFDVGAYEPIVGAGPRQGMAFLGNFFHPPNLDGAVWWAHDVAPCLAKIVGRSLPLRLIGLGSDRLILSGEASGALEPIRWVEDLGSELPHTRLHAVPLRYGAGTKDKIAMAMRYGLPTVTTAIGAEAMPEGLRAALVVADEPQAMAEAVAALMLDDGLWEHQAALTREGAARAWRSQAATDTAFRRWFRRVVRRESPVMRSVQRLR